MDRAGKIAGIAVLGGLGMTLALVAAAGPPPPRASAPPQISGADAQPDFSATLRRCRTVSVADAQCEAAWEAKQRHFFGKEKDAE